MMREKLVLVPGDFHPDSSLTLPIAILRDLVWCRPQAGSVLVPNLVQVAPREHGEGN